MQRRESSALSSSSSIQSSVSIVQLSEFSVQSSESSVQIPASRVQRPESNVQSPASRVQRPESSVQSPVSRVQRPKPSVQLLRPESRNSGIQSSKMLAKNLFFKKFYFMLLILNCFNINVIVISHKRKPIQRLAMQQQWR